MFGKPPKFDVVELRPFVLEGRLLQYYVIAKAQPDARPQQIGWYAIDGGDMFAPIGHVMRFDSQFGAIQKQCKEMLIELERKTAIAPAQE